MAEELAGPSHVPDDSTIRILLLGRSGSGKSTAGNTILGRKAFISPKRHKEKVTRTSEEQSGDVGGRKVCVIDTPDLLDPDLSEDQLKEEKDKLLSLCQSGLHAVLLMLPVGGDPKNEEEMLEFIKELLGPDIQRYTIMLFTRGDDLEDDETIEQLIKKEKIQQLMDMGCGMTHVFDNRHTDGDQLAKLLQKVDTMITKNEGHFTINIRRNKIVDFAFQVSENLTEERISEFAQLLKEEEEKIPKVRIVLLGKTGVGKSASGNTILGRNVFKSEVGSDFRTVECQAATKQRCGKQITVVDTPGIFGTKLSEEKAKEAIVKCMAYVSPGPHVFLIVINLAVRFTPEEKQAVELIRAAFGEEALKYTMILFTHEDSLDRKTINQYLQEDKSGLKDLVEKCGRRYHCFNNKSCSYPQFKELFKKIDTMVTENGERYYTNEMLQKVERKIISQMLQNLKRRIKYWKYPLRMEANRNTTVVLSDIRNDSIRHLIQSQILITLMMALFNIFFVNKPHCRIQ